jgi:hypothetical protein
MRRVLALLLLVLPLCACGGDVTSIDPIAQAAEKTTNVAGTHFVMSARIAAEGETVEFRGPGEIADHGRKLHMQMTMPGEILGIKGAGKKDITLELIAAGGNFYVRGGPFTELAELAGGKEKWVRIPDTEPGFDLGQNDPSKMLEYLRATSKVEERGSDTVRGIETTHYEARIQLDKVAERVSPDAAQTLKELTQGAGIKEIPLEVWVDKDSLVRRLKMNWHPKGGSFVMETELFDFGDVQIHVPDASATISFAKLLGGG